MKKIISIVLICVATLGLIVIGASSLASPEIIDEKINIATLVSTAAPQIQFKETLTINDLPLEDNQEIYELVIPDSVVYIYVTVQKGNASDNTDHTWEEVNSSIKWIDNRITQDVVNKAEAIVQFGDQTGPLPGEVGYGDIVPNATIQIRGASTTTLPQKSYKIELRDRAGTWRGQSTIALNKHAFDIGRMRNKL